MHVSPLRTFLLRTAKAGGIYRLALALLLLPAGELLAAKIRLSVETPAGLKQRIYVGRPVNLGADRPVVFVLHGGRRDAGRQLDEWYGLAEEHGFLLVAPEFGETDFPGEAGYEFGNVYGPKGGTRDPSRWAFSVIESLFDRIKTRFELSADRYALYGHSAGAGFVHRFLFHVPEARVSRAVAVDAERYTAPELKTPFPEGWKGSNVGPKKLRTALQQPLLLLLTETAQDAERLVRGQAFFAAGRAEAARQEVPFGWQLVTLPLTHDNSRKMAQTAIPYLIGE